eukprot:TRINITY_DN48449_c0_g1_i2.p1 TRINITY_DN48449_c0_g1~~TRINITY_DN48449_c0_g1_i2.p1  ORF type:complete len:342 (-),score=20.71 TRINITY_DN48449_c0_g1_i2:101-1126(-)
MAVLIDLQGGTVCVNTAKHVVVPKKWSSLLQEQQTLTHATQESEADTKKKKKEPTEVLQLGVSFSLPTIRKAKTLEEMGLDTNKVHHLLLDSTSEELESWVDMPKEKICCDVVFGRLFGVSSEELQQLQGSLPSLLLGKQRLFQRRSKPQQEEQGQSKVPIYKFDTDAEFHVQGVAPTLYGVGYTSSKNFGKRRYFPFINHGPTKYLVMGPSGVAVSRSRDSHFVPTTHGMSGMALGDLQAPANTHSHIHIRGVGRPWGVVRPDSPNGGIETGNYNSALRVNAPVYTCGFQKHVFQHLNEEEKHTVWEGLYADVNTLDEMSEKCPVQRENLLDWKKRHRHA